MSILPYHRLCDGEHAARDAIQGTPRQQQACGVAKRHREPPNRHAGGREGHQGLAANQIAPGTPKPDEQKSEELVDGRAQTVEVNSP